MSLLLRALIPALSLFLFPMMASAQVVEIEPNDPCTSAQDLGSVGLPFYVQGNLDASVQPEVDFFRVVAVPGASLRVDLEGATVGMGTLTDPYLGFFNSACERLAVNDDGGGALNSRLYVLVPEDGIAVFGVTRCCDFDFIEGGEGTYTLTVAEASLIGSISGRAVDARTYLPLPGDAPPYAWIGLFLCNEYGCGEYVNSGPAGPDGTFYFNTDTYGAAIPAGSFQVTVYANGYEMAVYGPFEVGADEAFDAGDIPVAPVAYLGAVSGRIVSAASGQPLSGTSPPFAWVDLRRCDEYDCYPVAYFQPGEDGRFRIEGMPYGLPPGTYRVVGFADDYLPRGTDPRFVGDNEEVDFGDVALTPLPIGFGEVTGCDFLPIGGTCEFGVQVTNRGPGRYRGDAWAIGRYIALAYPNLPTRFQIGRMGIQNPMPQKLNLGEGGLTTLRFMLDVPAGVPEGTYLCVTVNVGRAPAPQFDAAGERLLFCAVAQPGGMARLSSKESKRLLDEMDPRGR